MRRRTIARRTCERCRGTGQLAVTVNGLACGETCWACQGRGFLYNSRRCLWFHRMRQTLDGSRLPSLTGGYTRIQTACTRCGADQTVIFDRPGRL